MNDSPSLLGNKGGTLSAKPPRAHPVTRLAPNQNSDEVVDADEERSRVQAIAVLTKRSHLVHSLIIHGNALH